MNAHYLLQRSSARRLRRERARTILLFAAIVVALTLRLMLAGQARLAADHSLRLADGSQVRLVADSPAEPASPAPLARTRYLAEDVTVHDGAPTKERVAFVDPSFAQVFALASCQGSIEHALARGDELVLTTTTARRLFGHADPIGRSLILLADDGALALRVGAVMCDPPPGLGLAYTMLATLEPFGTMASEGTPLPAHAGAELRRFERLPPPAGDGLFAHGGGRRAIGRWSAPAAAAADRDARTAARLALATVLLACLGWSLARLAPRRGELAVHRAAGATRVVLALGLLREPLALAAAAGLIATVLTEWLVGGDLAYAGGGGTVLVLARDGGAVLVALAAASLWLLVAGTPLPGPALRRRAVGSVDDRVPAYLPALQAGLLALLLAPCLALLAAEQASGIDETHLVSVDALADPALNPAQRTVVLQRLAGVAGVRGSATGSALFGRALPRLTLPKPGGPVTLPYATVDPAVLPLLGARLLAGRSDRSGVVLAADAAHRLGFATPAAAIGRKLGSVGQVVGVVTDLRHAQDTASTAALFLVQPTSPPDAIGYLRVAGPPPLAALRRAWQGVAPDTPFAAASLATTLQPLRQAERRAALPLVAAALAAVLATLVGGWTGLLARIDSQAAAIRLRRSVGAGRLRLLGRLAGRPAAAVALALVAVVSWQYLSGHAAPSLPAAASLSALLLVAVALGVTGRHARQPVLASCGSRPSFR